MPSALLCFRSVCGQFVSVFLSFMSKRLQFKITIKRLTLKNRADGVMAGLLVALFCFGHLLFLSGDIELNPGPPKSSNSRQTRLTTVGRANRCNADNTTPPEPVLTESSEPTLQDVMSVIQSMTDSLSETCQSIRKDHTTERKRVTSETTSRDVPETEPTTKDMMSLLHNINCKFDDLKQNVLELTNVCFGIQNEITNVKQKITELTKENEDIRNINSSLTEKIETLENKTDRLESELKKNNVILHGVSRKEKETNIECEETVRNLLTDKLKLDEDINFEDIHRINTKPESPIFVRFSSFRQRQMVLKNRFKLQGTRIFVSEDYPLRVREIRKKLLPFLKEAKQTGKKATLVYDCLLIDGQKLCLRENGGLKVKE